MNFILYSLVYKWKHTLFLYGGTYTYMPAATSALLFLQSNCL